MVVILSRRRLQSAAFVLFVLAGVAVARGSFTLEQVMSSPFPTELVAAPSGGRVAWVFHARGLRNIWVAEPSGGGGYQARQLTRYTQDDGQEIGEITWTPDGRAIVYVRGGDFETGGPYPNPASAPEGVEQDVWVVPVEGGASRKLAEGHSPAVAPKGDGVAYIFKDQVWVVKLVEGAKPEQLIHDKGKDSSLRRSPDGSRLAFVSRRGDHSFVGVYDVASKGLQYLDPSVDQDSEPVWSPDSKQIAFLRLPASRDDLAFGPKRAGPPWSIRVADAATGQGHEVWRAEAGRGSVFRKIVAESQIFWGAGDNLVFPWERDGWTHLYWVPVAGGAAKLLTPGDFEVEFVSLSPDRCQLIFASNQDDIDRRHLWSEPVMGDHPTQLTRGEGIEWSPAMLSDGATVALLHSDAQRPARPATLVDAGGIRDLAPETLPADFPAADLVTPLEVILPAADGLRVHAQLFLPGDEAQGQRHPAVIFMHGGSRRQMLLGWHYMGYYHNAYALNQYLARRGYVVLSLNYRSGIGYGLDFREAPDYGPRGASEFNDVQGAGLYLRQRADVDPNYIGLWGGSYGGYLTALGLARASELFACGVDLHGVHDWNLEIQNWPPSYDPAARPDAARLAWESSPLASVKSWRSPVLLIQGDDDRSVPFGVCVITRGYKRAEIEARRPKMRFLPYEPNQAWLLPPSVKDVLGEDHLCFFVHRVVEELDLSQFEEAYVEEGPPAYAPALMVKVWLYAYALQVTSSRRLEQRIREDLAFRYLAGGATPDHWTLNDFRTRHRRAINDLFLQVVEVARGLGMAHLGHVAIDSTRVQANASRRRTETERELRQRLAQTRRRIRRWQQQCAAAEGDEEPGTQVDPSYQQQVRQQLEQTRQKLEKLEKSGAQQLSSTDPDSRFLHQGQGFVLGYRVDLAVSDDHVIVAQRTTQAASDSASLLPMVDRVMETCGEWPEEVSADSAFFSVENVEGLEARRVEGFVPDAHLRGELQGHRGPLKTAGDGPAHCRMRTRLRSPAGKARYQRRQALVEPVIGVLKEQRGMRRVRLRGLSKVGGEIALVCTAFNLTRLWRQTARA